jgi:hypothetical protein
MTNTITQKDIDTVKRNLNNMISFNKDLLNNSNMKLENAYALLSQTDDKDLGLQIGLDLVSWCLSKLADLLEPAGPIAANFLSGLVSGYSSNTPPALNDLFSSLLIRLQKTFLQSNDDLAVYYQDPVANWDKAVGGTFKTPFGTKTVSGKVSDLVGVNFPVQSDPSYYTLLNGCLKALDQGIWATLLTRFVITDYQEDFPPMWNLPCNPDENDNNFLPKNKSYYNVWSYHEDKDCYGNLVKYYTQEQYNIGTGAGTFSDGALNDSACDYLFHNYSSAIANPDGLFERSFVMTGLGIPTAVQHIHNRPPQLAMPGMKYKNRWSWGWMCPKKVKNPLSKKEKM